MSRSSPSTPRSTGVTREFSERRKGRQAVALAAAEIRGPH